MITFGSGGQLGNRLFQYVSARLLAEKLGMKLATPYDYNDTLTATPYLPGKEYSNDKLHISETTETGDILEDYSGKRHIHLQGYWQESKYYLPNRRQILSFFNEKATTILDKENIIMHVRLTDYKGFGSGGTVLAPQYYIDCLKMEEYDNLFIVTDAPDDPYLRAFDKLNPIYRKGTEREDFWFLTKFDRIIAGNSTFSWWAAFLSNARKIYVPKCWVRNSYDINRDLENVGNGKTSGIKVEAGFIEY